MKQWLAQVYTTKKEDGELQLFDEWLINAPTEAEARTVAQEQVKNAYPDASDWSVQEYTERKRKAYQGFGYEPGDEISKYYRAKLPDYDRPEGEQREYDLPSPAMHVILAFQGERLKMTVYRKICSPRGRNAFGLRSHCAETRWLLCLSSWQDCNRIGWTSAVQH